MEQGLKKVIRLLDGIIIFCAWPGRLCAWLILPIVLLSVISIIASHLRLNVFFSWEPYIFLFGNQLNVTSVIETQWHLFAAMMLFAGSYTFAMDRHVRVDIFYAQMSEKKRLLVNIAGDLLFLLPLCLFIFYYGCEITYFSYISNEISSEMGLTHRWVVKSLLPLAMLLLSIQAFCRGIGGILRLVGASVGYTVSPLPKLEENI